ncbi:vWA domain-containing protein [Vibrio maerlii]|uniref:vWA domain-containing protein n=1 Tax=Vibrio maerlii TaxID=2231648 RepID=UPI000E3C38BD|nr:TadE/TadG family type IV pilus assembly protein [Vibrio maerlii]
MNYSSKRKQSGHAAILFVLTVPVLMGLFSLATDGARMMQNQARMEDALEAASLAVSALNDPNESSQENASVCQGAGIKASTGSVVNRNLVCSYLNEYMVGMDSIDEVNITKIACDGEGACTGDDLGHRYFEYQVNATTKHSTWFSSTLSNDSNEYTVYADAMSQKFQNHAVDVVFVSDYSGSMDDSWTGTGKKYKALAGVIKSVTEELDKYNSFQNVDKNTAGYVGYNRRTAVKEKDKDIYLVEECDLWFWGFCWRSSTKEVEVDTGEPSSGEFQRREVTLQIYDHVLNSESNLYSGSTITHLFDLTEQTLTKRVTVSFDKDGNYIEGESVYYPDYNSDKDYFYYSIPLTTNFDVLNTQIESFFPKGGTSSYQGLIRGAQIAEAGKNPRRLIILLSDGMDNYTGNTTNLVSANPGMCTKIRSTLDAQVTDDGVPVSSKIAVIGFDYDVDSNTALQNCAGQGNVYEAQNTQDILNIILELIVEEIGHLK